MNYASLIKASCVDYYGWSVVAQLSGCNHMCDGCFNKKAMKSSYGSVFDERAYQELYEALSKPFIDNLVLQGGDPLYHKNIKDVITLCKRIRKELPDKNIVIFTGYTIEEIQNDNTLKEVLNYCDVIIDGIYDKNLPPAQYRGSSNQRIIEVKNL